MDVIEAHAARLPATDDRWVPRRHSREELARALVEGGVAGVVSHPLDNVRLHVARFCEGDPDKQFGMTGLGGLTPREVLELVGAAAGFVPEPGARTGPVVVDPDRVLAACEAVGDRLALACSRGERVVLATGHPVGLVLLYAEVGRLLAACGARLLRPAEGARWRDGLRPHPWQIRYLGAVALLTDRSSARHTHAPDAMERILAEARPDLVFADHGFAGAAIEAGVETLSIADVNDPALVVARALGRTELLVVMDDNVQPDAYWPCFQAIASRVLRSEVPQGRGPSSGLAPPETGEDGGRR